MRRILPIATVAAASLVAGCTSLSGLDASSGFSCKAAPGVTCQSISGVHQNASAGNLPFQRAGDASTEAASSSKNGNATGDTAKGESGEGKNPVYGASTVSGKVSPRDMEAASSGMPVRQPPLVLRVWMAPYEDEGGDLYDQSYFYTMVHSGRWMIEANKSTISNQFRPIYPLTRPTQAATESEPAPKEAQPLIQKGEYDRLVEKPEVK